MSRTILAIDGSASARELISFVLGKAGFEVVLAEDGLDGVQKLNDLRPDLVVTDIDLAQMDAFGVIEAARARPERGRPPVLILTAETCEATKSKAREAGAAGWIAKPFSPSRLVETINRVAATSSSAAA